MKSWVLDAGVAAKWYLNDEALAVEARDVQRGFMRGQVALTVPDLFWTELGNVLWKAARQGRIHSADAESALRDLSGFLIPTTVSRPLIEDAFHIALAHGRTVYDCVYVATAIETGAEMLTADERLVNALGSRYPVRWLGAQIT